MAGKQFVQSKLFEFISRYISLSEEEKMIIISHVDNFRSVKKGTILLREGQTSQESYFILEGCIRTYYISEGEEKTTAFYTEMEAMAPVCVFTNMPSDCYVACVEDSLLLISTPEMESEMFDKFPKFEKMCRMLSEEQLAKQKISFDEFKMSSPEERYLKLLYKRPDLLQRIPQHQIASFLGITPQSLSRLRARILEKSKG
jgi:CRP-like cAMP-binding protein